LEATTRNQGWDVALRCSYRINIFAKCNHQLLLLLVFFSFIVAWNTLNAIKRIVIFAKHKHQLLRLLLLVFFSFIVAWNTLNAIKRIDIFAKHKHQLPLLLLLLFIHQCMYGTL
jgi:hypothetical protein